MLKEKRITVAVTGGIAAYKVCEIVRGLVKRGAQVRVAMTENATRFVGPTTFEALSGHEVALTEWARTAEGAMPHIDLNMKADLLLVAPATANTLAKAAHGIADDLVSALILAHRAKLAFVPAMNRYMWGAAATQRNVAQLTADGALMIGPDSGFQACGDTGEGRMSEPAAVLEAVEGFFTPKLLAGRRVVVTAGPTYEAIDDVRGITNRSSGKQGFALARVARDMGAAVTLIAGPGTPADPPFIEVVRVESAREMAAAVEERLTDCDLFVGVAAVADWYVENRCAGKIKKSPEGFPALQLAQNPDIVARAAARGHGVTVAFAAEAQNLAQYARAKLEKKRVDMVVGNLASDALGADTNRVLFVTPEGDEPFGPADKSAVAYEICRRAAQRLHTKEER